MNHKQRTHKTKNQVLYVRTQVQSRYNRFKEGREDANDDVRPGRPSATTTDENI